MMEYKGYRAVVELDDEAGVFHGRVADTRDVITFEGSSVEELRTAFHDSVEDYLAFCAERGEEPERPYSGKFLVRMSPAQHRSVAIASAGARLSINQWVVEQLDRCAGRFLNRRVAAALPLLSSKSTKVWRYSFHDQNYVTPPAPAGHAKTGLPGDPFGNLIPMFGRTLSRDHANEC